jgi:chromosome segregation ATPase
MAIVTFEAVATAAEALQAAGQRASVRAVTAAIGGGSPNTILKLLGEWKAGRPVVRAADTELDPKITAAIVEQMQRVATAAAAAAEERAAGVDEDLQALSEAQAAAEQQINALTAELDAATTTAAKLAEQLEVTQADASRAAEQATAAAAGLRQELATERQRQEAAAAALARAEVRLEAVPGLQAEIERLRTALEADQKARQLAEQSAAVFAAKLEAAERRATEAEARTVKAEAAAAQVITNAEAAAQANQSRLESVLRELDAAKGATATATAAAQKSGEEAAELRGQLEALKAQAERPAPVVQPEPAKPVSKSKSKPD